MVEQERIARAVRELLEAVGEDPRREGLRETPQRVAAMYAELLSGMAADPREGLTTFVEEGHQELVIVRDLPFASLCEHHLLPFFGTADLAYIPRGRVAGVSKLARALQTLSHRLQVQERLTNQLADVLADALQPEGVAVALHAEHLCMTVRGARAQGSSVVTTAHRGRFLQDASARAEFLALTRRREA